MKNKHFFTISIALILSLSLAASSAWAGNVQRNRWEGIAIGLGAALLGSAIYNHHIANRAEREVVYVSPHRHQKHYNRHRPSGYWEIRKEWIPPTYEEVWNPGHYNRRGRWVEGHWMEVEKEPGYWVEKRVWVSRKPYRDYD